MLREERRLAVVGASGADRLLIDGSTLWLNGNGIGTGGASVRLQAAEEGRIELETLTIQAGASATLAAGTLLLSELLIDAGGVLDLAGGQLALRGTDEQEAQALLSLLSGCVAGGRLVSGAPEPGRGLAVLRNRSESGALLRNSLGGRELDANAVLVLYT